MDKALRGAAIATTAAAVALLVWALAGCNGGGGTIPTVPPEMVQMLVEQLGMMTGSEGTRSPTCPHDDPGMLPVHVGTMLAVQTTVPVVFPAETARAIREWAASTEGALVLLGVANVACCPVSKGLLVYGGWAIEEYPNPADPEGHPLYRIRHGDGRVLPPDEGGDAEG